jgi:glycosyltransferase involved in cell wall biosynthesis
MRQRGLSVPAEILVVDNGSTDDTARVVASVAGSTSLPIHHLYEPRIGLSYARNAGIAKARGDVVAFLDDDAWAEPEWLSALWKPYAYDPAIVCVGGKIVLDWSNCQPPRWLRPSFLGYLGTYDLGNQRCDLSPRDLLPFGGNISFRRSTLETVGGFRNDLGRSGNRLGAGEEGELCRRLLKAGHRIVYEPNAVVHHIVLPFKLKPDFFLRLARDSGITDTREARAHGEPRIHLVFRYGILLMRALGAWCIYTPLPAYRFAARLTLERVMGKWQGLFGKTGATSEESHS